MAKRIYPNIKLISPYKSAISPVYFYKSKCILIVYKTGGLIAKTVLGPLWFLRNGFPLKPPSKRGGEIIRLIAALGGLASDPTAYAVLKSRGSTLHYFIISRES